MTERSFAVLQPAPDEVAEVAAAIADEVAPKSASATKNARTMLISQDLIYACRMPFAGVREFTDAFAGLGSTSL